MKTKPRVPVGVGLLLVNSEGMILLHKRKGSHGAGTWAFPGGAVDPGEHPLDTAYRELQEEAGIAQPRAGSFQEIFELQDVPWVNSVHQDEDAGEQWVTLFFIAAHNGDKPIVMEPEKNEGWCWFSIDDLPPDDELFLPLRQIRPFLTMSEELIEAFSKRAHKL